MKKTWIGLLACALLLSTSVVAQNFPSKPIRLIVPYPPGGGNDTIARLLAQKINESWG